MGKSMMSHVSSEMMVRFLSLSSFLLLFGCGSKDTPPEMSPAEETRVSIGIVGGKSGVNVVLSPDRRTVRYLGEVENKGFRPFCPIDITFMTKGSNGVQVGPSKRVGIYGHTLSLTVPGKNGDELASCLKPAQTGSFDTGAISLADVYEDFDFKICFNGKEEACQRLCLNSAEEKCPPPGQRQSDILEVEDPKVPLTLILTEDQNDPMNSLLVRVQNSAGDSSTIPYDIGLHYTARNIQNQVIGTAILGVPTQQPCGSYDIQAQSALGCLTAGVLTDEFRFNTSTIASDICDGCSYFRIYHSECTLVGNDPAIGDGTCPN
jgi:hypothetical protein